MIKWLKQTFPDSYEFIRNFFKALNNKADGHSLRKWLTIGTFWVLAEVCIRYTTPDNAVAIATILSSLITTLAVTYSVSNHQAKKLEVNNKTNEQPPTEQAPSN